MTLKNAGYESYSYDDAGCSAMEDIVDPQSCWHVLWTRSNFEQRVLGQLADKNYEVFLPMMSQWSQGEKGQPVRSVPMFKGYLFLRHAINKAAFLDIAKTKGLVAMLGRSWNQLAEVPDEEIASIKQIMDSLLPTTPYPYLKAGTEVRIIRGPMLNARGILVRTEQEKGHFVISVQLLQRSVAVSINCSDVVPA